MPVGIFCCFLLIIMDANEIVFAKIPGSGSVFKFCSLFLLQKQQNIF